MYGKILLLPYLRLRYKYFPGRAQKFWAQELLNTPGLSGKLGQIFGQGKQKDNAPTKMSHEKVKRLFEKTFHTQLTFHKESFSASMGEVFYVEIKNKNYALKMLHPGIKKKIKNEINNLITLATFYAKLKKFKFQPMSFHLFLNHIYEEETDLKKELLWQQQFFNIFQEDKKIRIPQVITHYSNQDFLCQERLTCQLADELNQDDLKKNAEVDLRIFDFFFKSIFNHHLLHGDLNDRNWGKDSEGTVVVYDFGCCMKLTQQQVQALKDLLLNHNLIQAFQNLGLKIDFARGREQLLRDHLILPLFFTPIDTSFAYSKNLKKVFGDDIKKLRENSAPWILLFMRSLFSLIKVYQKNNLPLFLSPLISTYLEEEVAPMDQMLEQQSTQIKIEVLEKDSQIVFMILPITALENLKDLMPEKVKAMIEENKIDDIIYKVKAQNFHPQDLFSLTNGLRSYRVWIE